LKPWLTRLEFEDGGARKQGEEETQKATPRESAQAEWRRSGFSGPSIPRGGAMNG